MHVLIPKIARRLGIKLDRYRRPNDTSYPQYDGESIACKSQTDSNILHDIAHWLVATPERRCVPDFGLGQGAQDTDYDLQQRLPRSISYDQASDEEARASALGIAFEKVIDLNWKHTADWHSWAAYDKITDKREDFSSLFKVWQELQADGFLDEDYIPFVIKEIFNVQKRSRISNNSNK